MTRFLFISIDYGNFRIYFRGNSYAAKHLPEIKQKISSAFERILSVVDTTNYYRGINLILTDSVQEMKELTGFKIQGGLALPGHDLVFFICNDKRRLQLKHEIFHFIADDIWGNTASRLLNEGGAVYTDNECHYDNPIYSINAYMLQEKKLYSFQSLINSFDEKAKENEVIAYLESAAIFKYLYEKYGVKKLKQLWHTGFNDFETIYGKSLTQFEKEWKEHISTIKPPKNMDWDMLMQNGCD